MERVQLPYGPPRSFFVLFLHIYIKRYIVARKEKKYHFLYKTTNLLSGRYYIGMHSTDDLDDGYLGSGNRLRKAINKHGKENFIREILEFCESRIELSLRESEVVNLDEIAKEDCMNLVVGGNGFMLDEHHYNCSKLGGLAHANRMKKDGVYANKVKKTASDNFKKAHKEGKIKYNTFTGKKHSEETKKKMSESLKKVSSGKNNSQYGTCWITKNGENKKINKKELDAYISQGWDKGRKIK